MNKRATTLSVRDIVEKEGLAVLPFHGENRPSMRNTPSTSSLLHQVIVVVFPGFLLLDAAGPLQVFSMADEEAAKHGKPGYALRTVSVSGGMVMSSSSLAVMTAPLPRPASLKGATVFVVGGHGTEGAMKDQALIRWLQQTSRHAARCCSVCTGAFILAQAGLLEGRSAVTHWQDAPTFRRLFPGVRMLDDAIHVRDGHFYCSAGVTAGIDLSLSLVEADHGKAMSLRVAKRLVLPLHRAGGQRQFSAELLAQQHGDDELLARLTPWLQARLKQDISVADMAHAMALSERTLHRHLTSLTGQSPARFVNRLRLERACALLEEGRGTLKRVAQQSGFGSEYNLRRTFRQTLGVSPGDYQSRFAARGQKRP
jgi:transcriptional regulator GlxA family with amidase domain